MPNHWHFVLQPTEDGGMSNFLRWVSLTHTMRLHAHYRTGGQGHVYQGRFKSFPIQDDDHFLLVCRYVERNALRAGLVRRTGNVPATFRSPSDQSSRQTGPMRVRHRPPAHVNRQLVYLECVHRRAVGNGRGSHSNRRRFEHGVTSLARNALSWARA